MQGSRNKKFVFVLTRCVVITNFEQTLMDAKDVSTVLILMQS